MLNAPQQRFSIRAVSFGEQEIVCIYSSFYLQKVAKATTGILHAHRLFMEIHYTYRYTYMQGTRQVNPVEWMVEQVYTNNNTEKRQPRWRTGVCSIEFSIHLRIKTEVTRLETATFVGIVVAD